MTRLPLLILLFSLTLLAQQPGVLHGTLADPSGAPVGGAPVSLSGSALTRTAQTAADGSFTFAAIPPGEYTLHIDFPGLEIYDSHLTLDPGRRLELPIQLRLRVATQEVTVTGEPAAELSTDPSQNASATVVKDSDLDALPDDLDDLTDMLAILAGPAASGSNSPQILVDGFSGGKLPPKNTIKEIKFNQNKFAAVNEWAGSQIEIITKPGADKLHGTLGLTDSQAAFNSRNPYSANKADYLNRNLNASLGDALHKRVSWLFGFYRNTINNTALINAVTLDPSALAEVPIQSTSVVPRLDISGTARVDYQINASNTLTGSYRYLHTDRDNNGIGQYSLTSRAFASEGNTHELRLAENTVLSPHFVTDTRLGFVRNATFQYGDTTQPSLVVSGAFNSGSAQIGRTTNIQKMLELQSNTTAALNKHTVTFGGRLRYNPIEDISPSNFGGTFSFFGVAAAPVLDANNQPIGTDLASINSLEQYRRTLLFESLHDTPQQIRALGGGASQFSIAAGNPKVQFSQTDLALYIGDDWRVRPNLTISPGLRYENQNNIHDNADFAPRLAIAWSPGSSQNAAPKTVFRAGSGFFYNRFYSGFTQQALRFNSAAEQQYVVNNPDFYPVIPSLSTLAAARAITTYQVDPNLKATSSLFTEVSVERQLPGKTALTLSYTNQRTVHSFYRQLVNINAPLPDGTRPYGDSAGNILQFESGVIQKVQWLTVHVVAKPTSRISLTADYSRWDAHNDGDYDSACPVPNAGVNCPSNPYNRHLDWGQAGWTGPNYFSMFGAITLPRGLQLAPFLTARSGQIYNITTGTDLNADTFANDRPAFATDLSRPSVVITKFGAFDTDPLPGQTIVPRNSLRGAPVFGLNIRISKVFAFGPPRETPAPDYKGPRQHRYELTFSVESLNVTNNLNQGGYVGNLSSPLFGQSTAIGVYQDTSNNRKVTLGTQLTF